MELPRGPQTFGGRVVEALTLRHAAELARTTPPAIRDSTRPELALGRQKHEAAEALWSTGNYAEAIQLAKQALETTLQSLALVHELTSIEDMAEVATKLEQRGVPRARVARVTRVLERVGFAKLPTLDSDVTPEHDDLHRDILAARLVLDGAVRQVTMRPREVLVARLGRVAWFVAGVLVIIGGAAVLFKPPAPLVATCSGHWNNVSDSDPKNAIDGDLDTEWSLPDRTPGWLDLQLQPSRHVTKVRVMNGRNRPWNDRGSLAFHVDVLSNGRAVKHFTSTFGQWSAEPNWKEFAIGMDNIDHVRIYIDTFHGQGGSISDVQVE